MVRHAEALPKELILHLSAYVEVAEAKLVKVQSRRFESKARKFVDELRSEIDHV